MKQRIIQSRENGQVARYKAALRIHKIAGARTEIITYNL